MQSTEQMIAGIIAIGGGMAAALGYIGKMMVTAFCRQLEAQQQTLVRHTEVLAELTTATREAHRQQCECLSRICDAMVRLGVNGDLQRMAKHGTAEDH